MYYSLYLVLNADFYKKLDNVTLCKLAFYLLYIAKQKTAGR